MESRVGAAKDRQCPAVGDSRRGRFADWSKNLLAAAAADKPTLDLEAQAIRVNDILLVGMNMEIFCETGLAIKARSPLKHTLPLGYTNSSISYLPREADYPEGGLEIG